MQVVHLTESVAFLVADVSLRYGLAMADAIVYATANDQDPEMVTGDADLEDLVGGCVRCVESRNIVLFLAQKNSRRLYILSGVNNEIVHGTPAPTLSGE